MRYPPKRQNHWGVDQGFCEFKQFRKAMVASTELTSPVPHWDAAASSGCQGWSWRCSSPCPCCPHSATSLRPCLLSLQPSWFTLLSSSSSRHLQTKDGFQPCGLCVVTVSSVCLYWQCKRFWRLMLKWMGNQIKPSSLPENYCEIIIKQYKNSSWFRDLLSS